MPNKASKLRDEMSPDEVVRSLEFDILFGALRPRERLVEDILIKRFNSKRHVIRQALTELVNMGIVVREPNRGAAVRDFSAEEVEEISEIREILQRQAAERMQLPASAETIRQLEAAQKKHDDAVKSKDPRAIDETNEKFHRLFFEACGNRHLTAAIANYAYLSRAMRLYPMVEPALLETLRGEHWAMIEAAKSGDRDQLKKLVVEHIQHSKKIYLSVRQSLSITDRTD